MHLSRLLHSTPSWLLDVAIQSTALLVIAGAVTTLAPRLSAARRHFIQAASLLLIPIIMLCSSLAPSWHIPQSMWTAAPTHTEQHTDPFAATTALPAVATNISMMVSPADAAPSSIWAWIWLAGIGGGCIAIGFAARSLRRLSASSHPVASPEVQRAFQEETASLHLQHRNICLRMSHDCPVPMTWGLRHPVVLLPPQAAEWPQDRLRLVLRHELAHIARGDHLISLLTTVSALLLWFHPLTWLMLRASQLTREQACDDLALAHSDQSAADFAQELLAAVASLGTPSGRRWLPLALAMSISAGAKAMRFRLANIIQPDRTRQSYSAAQKAALLLPLLIGSFALAGLTACRKAATPSAAVKDAQILVTSRFISVPVDSPVLAEAGLVLNEGSDLQNLGILNEEQINSLLNKLAQQKGVHLLSAPSVTTRSGQKATMEITREFIYPTEFEPAKQLAKDQPVIPTTPTAFEMRPVGIRMDVTPEVGSNDSIELVISPEITSFEGFIDYGSPVRKAGDTTGTPLTQNEVKQPVFHSLKTTTSVVLQGGQSVVFGGLGRPQDLQLTIKPDFNNAATHLTTERLPETQELIFFVIQAKRIEVTGAPMQPAKPKTASHSPEEPTVTIFGQVKRQGKYTLKPGMTAQDLITQANGLSDHANATKAELDRGPQNARTKHSLDLTREGTKPLENGDILIVPER